MDSRRGQWTSINTKSVWVKILWSYQTWQEPEKIMKYSNQEGYWERYSRFEETWSHSVSSDSHWTSGKSMQMHEK